jgi:hypothetical protein
MKDEIINKTEMQGSPNLKYVRVFQGGDGLDHDEGGYNPSELTGDGLDLCDNT